MRKEIKFIIVLGIVLGAGLSLLYLSGDLLHEKAEPLAKLEFQWHVVYNVLEIKAYKDGWLEPETDLGLTGMVPGQPDEPDDIVFPPGGPRYAGNCHLKKNGEIISFFPHVDEKTVHFDTENGRISVRYRDVTMAPGEREGVIFSISPCTSFVGISPGTSLYEPENHTVRRVTLDNGIRVDIHHFDIPVYVEGLGRVGTCSLTVNVKENAYYEP